MQVALFPAPAEQRPLHASAVELTILMPCPNVATTFAIPGACLLALGIFGQLALMPGMLVYGTVGLDVYARAAIAHEVEAVSKS
jgi:hypothetical protein